MNPPYRNARGQWVYEGGRSRDEFVRWANAATRSTRGPVDGGWMSRSDGSIEMATSMQTRPGPSRGAASNYDLDALANRAVDLAMRKIANLTGTSGPAVGRVADLRRRAKRLLADERTARLRAQRTEALRRRASALLHADDWHVYFRARRKLIHLENERCRMGFELFGDPTAFGRNH
jgi:hypothetical protein